MSLVEPTPDPRPDPGPMLPEPTSDMLEPSPDIWLVDIWLPLCSPEDDMCEDDMRPEVFWPDMLLLEPTDMEGEPAPWLCMEVTEPGWAGE